MEKVIEHNGKELRFLEDGFMVNREEWDEEVGKVIAEKEGMDLSEEHWKIINFLREYYKEYLISPNIKILEKAMKEKLGDDNVNVKYLYTIFPKGPAYQGSKIAGLPKPKACIDG